MSGDVLGSVDLAPGCDKFEIVESLDSYPAEAWSISSVVRLRGVV